MTIHQFTSHGLDFIVEGSGFMNARDDFHDICARIEKELDGMLAADLAQLHTAAIATTDGPEAVALDDICGSIKAEVTRGWHNPNGCGVSLIALPND